MTRAAAVDTLYRVFERYPRSPGAVGCTHCVSEAEQDRLRQAPLRALGVEALRPVAHNAGVGTFGDVSDYKHFLPRLCELLAGEGRGALEARLIFAGLRLYAFDAWPPEEQRAVLAYLGAWLEEALEACDDADPRATVWVLRALADAFPSQRAFEEALWRLPDRGLARGLGHLGWSRDSLDGALLEAWQRLATAEAHRRLAPLLATLPAHDDLHLVLTELLGQLPTDSPDRRRPVVRTAADLERVLGGDAGATLVQLTLEGPLVTAAMLERLAARDDLRELKALTLIALPDGDDALARLSRGPVLRAPRLLVVRRSGLTEVGVAALARMAPPTTLASLSLADQDGRDGTPNRVGDAALRALAAAASLPHLEELDVSWGPVTAAGITSLDGARGLPALRRVTAWRTGLTAESVRALAGLRFVLHTDFDDRAIDFSSEA